MSLRIEKDSLGDVKVASEMLWGAQTQRAVDNFKISGQKFQREFIRALAIVKMSAARANMRLGNLEKKYGEGIVKAAEEILNGTKDEQFPLDIFQTGSGTSFNMNINEVISNMVNIMVRQIPRNKITGPS